ncbi:hypothetical protein L3Y34_017262 [Caenorhabditis briggsae]|uniref:SCP domain-containing protein n=4 Tax=Caenorhabditis briggsae TaxID=6238 RepID=A0AAE9DHT9_CAEBR|nr:hypothetical protein L3Y34_017262 [Caenorhabditis briggsae]
MMLLLYLAISTYLYSTVHSSTFDENAWRKILKAHNDFRSKISKGDFVSKSEKLPPATNMNRLRWNSQYGDVASKRAERHSEDCELVHHSGHYTENIWQGGVTNPAEEGLAAIAAFAGEFQKGVWDLKWSPDMGHAANMARGDLESVGCGYTRCTKDGFELSIVLCLYYPPAGEPAYKKGQTCSECSDGFSCEKKIGLCLDRNATEIDTRGEDTSGSPSMSMLFLVIWTISMI